MEKWIQGEHAGEIDPWSRPDRSHHAKGDNFREDLVINIPGQVKTIHADVTVVDLINPKNINESVKHERLVKAEKSKHDDYDKRVKTEIKLHVTFYAFAISMLGEWGPELIKLWKILKHSHTDKNDDSELQFEKSNCMKMRYMQQKIGRIIIQQNLFALQRFNTNLSNDMKRKVNNKS